ncbi:MAG: zf-HC2 domain-containing protein [Longimicrobiales bacterium]
MSHTSCLDALLQLYPYLDGELCDAEAEAVRRHFELCSPCTPALFYLKAFRNALHRASHRQPAAPAALRARVNAALLTSASEM